MNKLLGFTLFVLSISSLVMGLHIRNLHRYDEFVVLLATFANLQSEYIEVLESRLADKHIREVTLSAYTPREIETDSDPLVTASMDTVRAGTVAISRDLFRDGWTFGQKVYIEGLGVFKINDLMNSR